VIEVVFLTFGHFSTFNTNLLRMSFPYWLYLTSYFQRILEMPRLIKIDQQILAVIQSADVKFNIAELKARQRILLPKSFILDEICNSLSSCTAMLFIEIVCVVSC
jgi:hypothetical protein